MRKLPPGVLQANRKAAGRRWRDKNRKEYNASQLAKYWEKRKEELYRMWVETIEVNYQKLVRPFFKASEIRKLGLREQIEELKNCLD